MDEMVRYIFKSALKTDRALHAIGKTLKAQRSFNRWVLLSYLVLGVGYLENSRELMLVKNQLCTLCQKTEAACEDTEDAEK